MGSSYYPPPAAAPVDNYEAALRAALRAKFAQVTDAAKVARLMPMRMALKLAFESHVSRPVLREMISQVDVTDDAELSQIQEEMLNLPQWNQ